MVTTSWVLNSFRRPIVVINFIHTKIYIFNTHICILTSVWCVNDIYIYYTHTYVDAHKAFKQLCLCQNKIMLKFMYFQITVPVTKSFVEYIKHQVAIS
jgi:hypothetical protein